MGHGPAVRLEPHEVPLVFDLVEERSLCPVVDGLLFRLSFRGGLRSCEMAGLDRNALIDRRGRIRDEIRITVTKGHSQRTIQMHPDIYPAADRFLWEYPDIDWFAVSPRDGRQQNSGALGARFTRLYEEIGFVGCTSHTGRATCITEMVRRCSEFDCSIFDVMKFAGHKSITSTAKYLAPSEGARDMVRGLGRNHNRGRNTHEQGRAYQRRHHNQAEAYAGHRQHQDWMALQFARVSIQPERWAERCGHDGRPR